MYCCINILFTTTNVAVPVACICSQIHHDGWIITLPKVTSPSCYIIIALSWQYQCRLMHPTYNPTTKVAREWTTSKWLHSYSSLYASLAASNIVSFSSILGDKWKREKNLANKGASECKLCTWFHQTRLPLIGPEQTHSLPAFGPGVATWGEPKFHKHLSTISRAPFRTPHKISEYQRSECVEGSSTKSA